MSIGVDTFVSLISSDFLFKELKNLITIKIVKPTIKKSTKVFINKALRNLEFKIFRSLNEAK